MKIHYKIAIHILILFCHSCLMSQEKVTIRSNNYDANRDSSSSASHDRALLQIGYTSSTFFGINIHDGLAATRIMTENMSNKIGTGIETISIIFHDTNSIEKAIKEKRLDIIGMLPDEYLKITNRVDLEPLVVPMAHGRIYDEFILLVRRDSGIDQLGDLRQKRLIIETKGRGSIPFMWLNTILTKADLPESNKFFLEIEQATKASQTVLQVFFRQADACIVGRMLFETTAELNPQLKEKLTELACSPGFCFGLICCRMGFLEQYEVDLKKKLIQLHEDTQGKQLLSLFRMEKFVPFSSEYLENNYKLVTEYECLAGKSNE